MKTERDKYNVEKLIIEDEDDVRIVANACSELYKRALPIARVYLELNELHPAFSIDESDLSLDDDGDIQIRYETGGRGYYDDETTYLPARYLFDDDWKTKAEAELQFKKEKKVEADRIAKEKRAEDEVKQAREQYLKLRNRFEGES